MVAIEVNFFTLGDTNYLSNFMRIIYYIHSSYDLRPYDFIILNLVLNLVKIKSN